MTDYTCIACPLGCRVSVHKVDGKYEVSGYQCKRGEEYALKEHTHPERVLTATVRVEGAPIPLLPVRTNAPVPKAKLFECMRALAGVRAHAPIELGQLIVKDLCDTGADVIATRWLKRGKGRI